MHVENERLKTTLGILTKKLKVIEDDNLHISEGLQSQINMLEEKNLQLESTKKDQKKQIKNLTSNSRDSGNNKDVQI